MKTNMIKKTAAALVLLFFVFVETNNVFAQYDDNTYCVIWMEKKGVYLNVDANGNISTTAPKEFNPYYQLWMFTTETNPTKLKMASRDLYLGNRPSGYASIETDINNAQSCYYNETLHTVSLDNTGSTALKTNNGSDWRWNGTTSSDGVMVFYIVQITEYDEVLEEPTITAPISVSSNSTYQCSHANASFRPAYILYHFDGASTTMDDHYWYCDEDHVEGGVPVPYANYSYQWSLVDLAGNPLSTSLAEIDQSGLITTHNLPDGYLEFKVRLEATPNPGYWSPCDPASYTLEKPIVSIKTWREMVTTPQIAGVGTDYVIDGSGNVTIKSKNALAWLISTVNGANGQTPNTFSGKTVTLAADVDMSDYIWVPVGVGSHSFKGTFNGNGHLITGLRNNCGEGNAYGMPGLFGKVDGGEIKNAFVSASNFSAVVPNATSGHIGIICDTMTNGAVLHSSEAWGTLSATTSANILAMGGLVGLAYNNANVHSSMSMATLNGYNMGGAVGEIRNGSSLKNSFTHALYTSTNNAAGLAYMNAGAIDNCYVRVRSGNTLANMFVTEETGTVSNVYYPEGQTSSTGAAYTTTVTPYYYKHADNRVGSTPLLQLLNTNRGTGAEWMRTSAGTGNSRGTNSSINDDYPVLKLNDFNSLASSDGIVLRYGDINDLLASFTASTDAIDLYRSKAGVTFPSSTSAKLYINEDVALTHASGTMNAYVGITLDNSAGTAGANPNGLMGEGLTDNIDWHMFSSPLANAPLGIKYDDDEQHTFSWDESSTPHYSFYPESTQNGYFPSKTFGTNGSDGTDYYTEWDFYTYYEPDYHWINFKRNSNSHWHEDVPYYGDPANPADHAQIVYNNESTLTPGQGDLLATKEETYLQAYGNLNNEKVYVSLSYSAPQETKCQGYNLIGNPYQSYLDFDQFVSENPESGITSYVILDEDKGGYVSYAATGSKNDDMADRYINMHQGFFVIAPSAGKSVNFNPATMRSVEPNGASFRGSQPAYPLVNLIVKSENGNSDRVTVELDRPDNGGAIKMKQLKSGNGSLYVHHDGQDYSIIFMPTGTTSAAVRFESDEDGEFTMTWNTQNGTFSNLHLIDNIAGVDIDMNACSEYRFSANTKDYASRFKLMFTYTDVEENIDADHAGTFAFMMGGNLVVNGEGRLEVIDMNGRIISATELNGTQNTVALPNASQGLYMLRLTSGNGVRVQKIVVR